MIHSREPQPQFWTKLPGSILSPKEPAFVLAGNPCPCGPTGPALGPEGGWGVAQEGNFVNKHPDFLSKMRGGFYVQARWPRC